jgi:D-glycero-beta-D-manno-heptose 1-phosphate adenylyltransferase
MMPKCARQISLPSPAPPTQNASVSFRDKIIPWDNVPGWRAALRHSGKKLVVTNGCFDLLHLGHVTYLETARGFGDRLLVGLNSDASVRELKGPDRPVNGEADRAAVLAALESVSAVCLFTDKTALRFLTAVQPDIYVKGGDYTLATINQDERRTVEQGGGKIVILPVVPSKSTTALLAKLAKL